jgi:predicted metal-dependent peptidase
MQVIEKVIIRLLQSNGVFYASLLSQMRRICVTDSEGKKNIQTAGVTIQNGRILMYWNPDFFERLTLDEARAVLEHECMHIVMDHIARKGERDHKLWNIAADLAINQFIDGLPKEGITLDKFPPEYNLKPKDTAEHYYDILNKNSKKIIFQPNGKGGFKVTVKDSNGKTTGEFDTEGPGNHDEWKDADASELAKEIVRQAVKEAVDQTTKNQGHLPAGIEEAVRELLKPPVISWQQLLRKFVAASIKSGHKLSWKRPNRRFGSEQKGRLPDRTVALTVAIDTSGSIGTDEFQTFISEIRSIMDCYKGTVTVLECDADVQKEYKLRRHGKVDTKFKGRGGTSFKPVFTYVKEKKIKTDVLVYFTDMYGDFPNQKPPYGTIWVSTTEGQKAPFGVTISIPEHTPERRRK